jgi:hypothetical protein
MGGLLAGARPRRRTCVDGVNMESHRPTRLGHSSSNSEMYREIRQIADLVNGRPTIHCGLCITLPVVCRSTSLASRARIAILD